MENSLLVCWSSFGARSMCLAHLDCRFFTPWWTILFRLIFKRLLEFWVSANCQCFDRDGKFTPRLLLEFLCSLICLAHLDCIYPSHVMDHSLSVNCLQLLQFWACANFHHQWDSRLCLWNFDLVLIELVLFDFHCRNRSALSVLSSWWEIHSC